MFTGVPDENRTRVTTATEWRSTIELRAPYKEISNNKFQISNETAKEQKNSYTDLARAYI